MSRPTRCFHTSLYEKVIHEFPSLFVGERQKCLEQRTIELVAWTRVVFLGNIPASIGAIAISIVMDRAI